MPSFKEQIESDIKLYQERFRFIANIEKPEWAFNYWVLDKLFFEDEELIESKIVDYKDLGVDVFEIYEDTKDIYVIQNKYYNTTKIDAAYIQHKFLERVTAALENGTYTKSPELQEAFTKYKNDPEFKLHLHIYVTNNEICQSADDYVKSFNLNHPQYIATIYYLDNIAEKYYGEAKENKKNLVAYIDSVNGGTVLNINNKDYQLTNVIDAKYIFAPVVTIFKMYDKALKEGYPLFDKNIREYLGNTGVNKNIYNTLLDVNDRKNFFYYNNGITIICDSIKKSSHNPSVANLNIRFEILNPQIVNGCQTVNSIYQVLKNVNPNELDAQFKDTFVMLKVLEINRVDEKQESLYKNIVRYNNSQNSIDEKTFVSNTAIFARLQKEFENKGFLLLIKQSDKNTFSKKYKVITKLRETNSDRLEKFKLAEIKKASDAFIPLEKLLQVINAFVSGGYTAYVKKSNVLKYGSTEYKTATNFIKEINSIDTLLDLYMLYKKAEEVKGDGRAPIPYYLIDCFARYECKERTAKMILPELSTQDKIKYIITLYQAVTQAYANEYFQTYNIDYNKMIKQSVKYDIFDRFRNVLAETIRTSLLIK